jgi:hypothetical protein
MDNTQSDKNNQGQMTRMYYPSWLALKNSSITPKRISIAAHPKLHRRIYKAIIKEKDMDVVYKLQLSERPIPQRAWLSRESKDGILTIQLHFSIGLDDFI